MAQEKTKARKTLSIIVNVLLYVFLGICVIALIFAFAAKKNSDGAVSVFGIQLRVVVSDSMAECELTKDEVAKYEIGSIPVKSVVFIELVPEDAEEAKTWYSELRPGDVLTFRYVYVNQETITHRIKTITPNERGGYDIELIGDNKDSEDGLLIQKIDTSDEQSFNYVIGKVTGTNYFLGVIISALKSKLGIVLMLIVPCLIIVVFEIIHLVTLLGEKKKAEAKAKEEEKNAELEELKRQLAELKSAVGNNSQPTSENGNTEEKSDTEENN